MVYRTLGDLRSELSRRLGFGATGSAGINAGLLDSFLQGAQAQLYAQFDWRHLIKHDLKDTGVGQAAYDWAADCEPTRILSIAVHDGARWVPMHEGIVWAMRSDTTQGMPLRYERYAQMEVWPVPDGIYTMRRDYVQALGRFTQDNDRASLDDDMILLHALTNAKAHYRQPDHALYSGQLNALLLRLKGQNRGASVHGREPDDVYLQRPRDV